MVESGISCSQGVERAYSGRDWWISVSLVVAMLSF